MAYSCSDFVDSIIEALDVWIPDEASDDPAWQAEICLEAIAKLKRQAKANARWDERLRGM